MAERWYWFIFADGHQECCRGMSRIELAWEEKQHGKLIRKEMVIV